MSSSSKELDGLQIPSKETSSDIMSSPRNELDDLEIPLEKIALATNNFADKNLIYKGEVLNVYKGKLLGSGQLGNIVVQRRLGERVYEQWEDESWKDLFKFSAGREVELSIVGFTGDRNIIIYEHVGNKRLEKDLSDPTFSWKQRIKVCISLATPSTSTTLEQDSDSATSSTSTTWEQDSDRKPYFEMVYEICLCDLMFEVLCEKKGEHVTPMAIEHYEKDELMNIVHPHLREQMHQQSFAIFSDAAYECIVEQPSIDLLHIQEELGRALELQEIQEKIHDLEIPFEKIASATNNFADGNLIYKNAFIKIYKGKSLESGQRGNIVVQRRLTLEDNSYKQREGKSWKDLLKFSAGSQSQLSVLGFSGDMNIIIYKHVGNESLEKDVSDPTFTWMQRLQLCHQLAPTSIYVKWSIKTVYEICLGDLMFELLCEKKGEEHVTPIAIQHYQKGELKKIIHPHLRLQMDQQSLTIFSMAAYNCISNQLPFYLHNVFEELKKALNLQARHERYKELEISFEEIASATNNLSDQNLIYEDKYVKVYKGKALLGSGQPGDIVVRRKYMNDWQRILDTFDLSVWRVGFCADKKIIVYEHLGNQKFVNDISDPTFDWKHRIQTYMDLVNSWDSLNLDSHFEYVFSVCLGDLMFQVLCEKKKGDQDPITLRMAMKHYEKGELKKVIHPNLGVQVHHQSLIIFSEIAYACIKRPSINTVDINQKLQEAWELQAEHEKFLERCKIKIEDIRLSTKNFAKECFVGSGTYGMVYKAELDYVDRKSWSIKRGMVAIKSISNENGQGDQGFFTELSMLSTCDHPNVISLLGFCQEGSIRILIYDYAFKQSLGDYLGSSTEDRPILTWANRLQICLNIAHGLNYLHNNTKDKPRIIHRDIKSDNILFGENWNAKIGDFGLSKFHNMNQQTSTIKTKIIAGTPYYLDPEYERTGHLKKESDVYSFGVVLFEILSGRFAYDQVYLAENYNGLPSIARRRFSKGTLKDLVDPQMKEADEFISTLYYGLNQDSLDTFLKIAHRCLAKNQKERPTIEVVLLELQNALNYEENRRDVLPKFSFRDIEFGTGNFSDDNCIMKGAFGKAYNGKVQYHNELMDIVAMRLRKCSHDDDFSLETTKDDFLREHEILMKHKHENIIDLVGYCREGNEKIIVYGLASVGTLEMHLSNATLGWVERLKISIDVASALEFLHERVQVIHGDFKSANILLNVDRRARIFELGFCLASPLNKKMDDHDISHVSSTHGYCDPSHWAILGSLTRELYIYSLGVVLTRESDIYSLGVVLFEMMCGISTWEYYQNEWQFLDESVKKYFEEKRLDEIVFEDLKKEMVPHSLATFQMIAYQCVHHEEQKRPTAAEVVLQLKRALKFQMEHSSAGGMGSHSIQERVDSFIGDRDNNNGVGDQNNPSHHSFSASQDPKVASMGSPDGGSIEKSYITGLLQEIEELKNENGKMKQYQLELEAQLEAYRSKGSRGCSQCLTNAR